MSETKRVMIRSYDMTDVSRDTGEPRRIVDVPYVLASDYDRDLAEMRRQRAAALTRVAELEAALKELVTLKDWKDKYGRDLVYQRDQPLAWDKARDALAATEPRDG